MFFLLSHICFFFLSGIFPVPPIIEPFSFQDGLAEGMRTRTVCGVSRGDAPLSLRWLKDGEPLPSLLGANVTSLDQYSSLLSIPSLSATHSGDYTCVATNPASEVKFTAALQVKGNVLNFFTIKKKNIPKKPRVAYTNVSPLPSCFGTQWVCGRYHQVIVCTICFSFLFFSFII